ncbi:hypothetical protein VTJ83DRAFT_2124 [Remersonia thermophila]|uniref:ATP-dependent DNA helicase n=1 Tax=Remersonia thermophila TaxID=72144 RepID=A0ABR4DIF8_9PEZI
MDDDDEYGDIPDEDLILALEAAEGVAAAASSAPSGQVGGKTGMANAGPPVPPSHPSSRSQFTNPSSATRYLPQPRPPGQPQNLRQTTLWGGTLQDSGVSSSQAPVARNRPFLADLPPEPPTHHELNPEELSTWIYPLNLGPIRDYQFSIVKNALFHNTLVALPTGLGKTFIAATIMLNYFRWTKRAKLVFVAPTKPLASQQVEACLGIAGIPRSQASLLTGEIPPVVREEEWEKKRVFFMTPQTLTNDLSKGYADPKSIVLLVVDEAHRATGDYAYVKAVEFIRRFSKSFRVLALTATPGSKIDGVQEIIDNLGISHVEIRTEESIDIRQYVHSRDIDTMTFDPSAEMCQVQQLFSKALKPLVDKLSSQNLYFGRDPMSLTTYGLMKSRQEWMAGPGRHAPQGLKFMIQAVFTILQSLAHSIKLLNFHGIRPFYSSIAEFRASEEQKGGQGSKMRRELLADKSFQEMMAMIEHWMKDDDFQGHPKLGYLCERLVNHFVDAGEGSTTRAIVFSEYRDSAEEIVRLLNKQPLIRATVFVGQAGSKRSEGMSQKKQIDTIDKFKGGQYNVLVATSIGEEGLDIGQVDLIVCYDASASPIRMLQRMGRTGRKRAGNIVLLLMKGKEEDKFMEAKDNYYKMQQLICDGASFNFRHDISMRIIPRDIRPEVDKRHVEIPIENTQNPGLPEPKKNPSRSKKKPTKKFHMPDGVETGFVKASTFARPAETAPKAPPPPAETDFLADVPPLEKVLLNKAEAARFERLYKSLPKDPYSKAKELGLDHIDLGAYPAAQRALRPVVHVKHGEYTKRCVKLFRTFGSYQEQSLEPQAWETYGEKDPLAWKRLPAPPFADEGDESEDDTVQYRARSVKKKQQVDADRRRAKTRVESFFAPSSCEVTDDDGDDDLFASASLGGPQGHGRSWAMPEYRRQRSPGSSDHIEDFGDDCMRTSDVEKTDDSDSGRDLDDFVVPDDQVTSSLLHVPSSAPTIPSSSNLTIRSRRGSAAAATAKKKLFYEPVQFGLTQEDEEEEDDDDDMPDLDELVAASAKKAKKPSRSTKPPQPAKSKTTVYLDDDDDDDDDDDAAQTSPRKPLAKRRRKVLFESDDEEL